LGITQTDKQNKLKKLLKIINQIKFDEELFEKTEILGDSFEYLIALFATNNGKKAGEFYSPTQVSQILAKIVAFATPNAKDVYDFAMGSGSLLLGAKRELEKNGKVNVNIYGQEKISTTYNLARMNMIIHDVALDYINLVNGDTIENPEYFSGLKHDIIVANPPFNIKAVDKGEVFTHVDPKDIR
jgi:type I restriction enzyme M protein